MDAIAHIPRLQYGRGLSPSAAVSKGPGPRVTAQGVGSTRPTTPLWKRVVVQVAIWLGFRPRAVGASPLDAVTGSLKSAAQKDALQLLENIATAMPPASGTLSGKLLRNADVVRCLAALEKDFPPPPQIKPGLFTNCKVFQDWLAQQPDDIQRRGRSRIELLVADRMLQSPDARPQLKTLRAFCVYIQQALQNDALP